LRAVSSFAKHTHGQVTRTRNGCAQLADENYVRRQQRVVQQRHAAAAGAALCGGRLQRRQHAFCKSARGQQWRRQRGICGAGGAAQRRRLRAATPHRRGCAAGVRSGRAAGGCAHGAALEVGAAAGAALRGRRRQRTHAHTQAGAAQLKCCCFAAPCVRPSSRRERGCAGWLAAAALTRRRSTGKAMRGGEGG
jgi:hypothetical protein